MRSGTRLLGQTPKVRTRIRGRVLSRRSYVSGWLLAVVDEAAGVRQDNRLGLLADEERDCGESSEHRGAVGYFGGLIPAFSTEHKHCDDAIQDEANEAAVEQLAPT